MTKKTGAVVSHTNRRGATYYLHQTATKKGATRYVMKKSAEGALAAIPEGMEIVEDPNGVVSVRRIQPQRISPAEVALIEGYIAKLGLRGYRTAASGDHITVYAPLQSAEEIEEIGRSLFAPEVSFLKKLAERQGVSPSLVGRFESALEHTASSSLGSMVSKRLERTRVEPVMRFVLHDVSRRTFSVERMTYRGRCDWWPVRGPMSLEFAARKFLQHLGKDSFFELM